MLWARSVAHENGFVAIIIRSESLSHGLGIGPIFRRRQVLQMLKELPKGTKVELRMMET